MYLDHEVLCIETALQDDVKIQFRDNINIVVHRWRMTRLYECTSDDSL